MLVVDIKKQKQTRMKTMVLHPPASGSSFNPAISSPQDLSTVCCRFNDELMINQWNMSKLGWKKLFYHQFTCWFINQEMFCWGILVSKPSKFQDSNGWFWQVHVCGIFLELWEYSRTIHLFDKNTQFWANAIVVNGESSQPLGDWWGKLGFA